jgi:hypothetical protein
MVEAAEALPLALGQGLVLVAPEVVGTVFLPCQPMVKVVKLIPEEVAALQPALAPEARVVPVS